MKIHIALDRSGNIHITDSVEVLPEDLVRYSEHDFPNNGRKREIITNFSSTSFIFEDNESRRFPNA